MPLFLSRSLKESEVGKGREEFEYVERVRMRVVQAYPWWSLRYYGGEKKATWNS